LSPRRLVLALAVVVVAGAVIAVTPSSEKHKLQRARVGATSVRVHRAPGPASIPVHRPALARPLVARLTPLQLLGQRIVYAYAGPTPPAALLARIRRGEAAGVIFFGPNVADPAALGTAIRTLRAANEQSPVHAPLLLMTDQEGGLVRRLPGAPSISEKQIGQSDNAATLATEAGAGAGATLAGVGMNVNLAPVLDVFRAPGNFIDGTGRSYSSDPQLVASLGARFISAQQRTGVAATAKHFPGLGAATADQNTDEVPGTLEVSAAALRADDELPYRAAITAGVKLVMTSWATYPALDPSRPAGLSPAVIGGELRGRLGYRGVVTTDELAAGALGAFGTIPHRAVLAAGAGADLLLCSQPNPDENTPAEGEAALQGLLTALADGQISRAAAEPAAARVIRLRASLR
jgi:beta-N-acetylhexosaminidase